MTDKSGLKRTCAQRCSRACFGLGTLPQLQTKFRCCGNTKCRWWAQIDALRAGGAKT